MAWGIDVEVAAATARLSVALQPIVGVATGRPFAYEALARFDDDPAERVIARAEAAGHGVELELNCIRAALDRRADLPAGVRLSINVSPDALLAAALMHVWGADLSDLIVEITEHAVQRPAILAREVERLRSRGALVAVDDVGTGYAGLLRLASLRPDVVKIDRSIVTGVRDSLTQAAVLDSLVAFSHRIGASVIAEGVESAADLTALAEFDVDLAQGFLLGRPAADPLPVPDAIVELCRSSRAQVFGPGFVASGSARAVGSMAEATSLLALATEFAQLREAVEQASRALDVDVVSLSALGPDAHLRELVCTGLELDATAYPLADYPATRRALELGQPVEVHLSDADADPGELAAMRRVGAASLLIVPLGTPTRPAGILEFFQRRHRLWTTTDVVAGRGLALHVATALARLLPTAHTG